MSVHISVALATRNRPERLGLTLASLRAQDAQPFEVVVSDDSDDGPAPAVEAVAVAHGCRYVRGPRRGLYANRNHGALACRGTHVRSMDDDHEFPPGHWRRCEEAVAADSDSIWILGEYLAGQERPERPPPCPGQLTPRGYSEPPPDPDDCWSIGCGSSIYPRNLFERGVRNAEFFKFGALYLEFGSRLHWLGYRIRFLPSTYVIHYFDEATRSYHDREINLSSQFLAMLCHSRIYRPTLHNRMWTWLEIAKLAALHRRTTWRALRSARAAFAEHRAAVLRQKAEAGRAVVRHTALPQGSPA
jgi:glycosyltransferase involved in cell wall biosynthesis